MSWDHWLAEITAHDGSSVVNLAYANGNGFTFARGTTPGSENYKARIKQPVNVQRALFTPGSTQGASRIGFGELVLLNGDGALDALNGYGFDGRTIRILRSDVKNPSYSDFEVALVATMEQPEFQTDTVRIKLRDNRFQLAKALQETKYTGAGLGTLEGTEDDLKGKPKPVCLGSVKYVKPPCVETAKLIYQVHDGEVAAIGMAYDRGVPLSYGFPVASHETSCGIILMANDQVMVCVRTNNTGDVKTSADGITFTARTTAWVSGSAPTAGVWCEALDKFIVVGAGGKIMYGTADGVTWTSVSAPAGVSAFNDVAEDGAGNVVAVGQLSAGGVAIYSTTDATTWTARTDPFVTSSSGLTVAGSPDRFVIGGNEGPDATHLEAAYSTDGGATWTQFEIEVEEYVPGTGVNVLSFDTLRYQRDRWVGVSGFLQVVTSLDGEDWIHSRTFSADLSLTGGRMDTYITTVRDHHVVLLVGTTNSVVMRSSDLAAWTLDAVGPVGAASVLFYNEQVYVGAFGSTLYKSSAAAEYASSADLLDDTLAPAPGTYKTFLDSTGSYFRLGAAPDGEVTCDVTQGAAASDRTTAQVFETLLARESITPTAGDLTTLDAANNDVIGYWTDEETTVAEVADAIAQSIGASWYIDKDGAFRIKQLTLASGTPAIELTASDIIGPPIRLTTSDVGHGLPVYRVIVRWGKNYTVQTSDIAAGVSASRRAYLADEWRESKAEDTAILTKHLLSPELTVETLLQVEADAAAEATRLLTLRKTQRDRIVVTVPFTSENAAVDLMDVVKLTHDRLGLSGGKLFRLIGIDASATENRLRWSLWG